MDIKFNNYPLFSNEYLLGCDCLSEGWRDGTVIKVFISAQICI